MSDKDVGHDEEAVFYGQIVRTLNCLLHGDNNMCFAMRAGSASQVLAVRTISTIRFFV